MCESALTLAAWLSNLPQVINKVSSHFIPTGLTTAKPRVPTFTGGVYPS